MAVVLNYVFESSEPSRPSMYSFFQPNSKIDDDTNINHTSERTAVLKAAIPMHVNNSTFASGFDGTDERTPISSTTPDHVDHPDTSGLPTSNSLVPSNIKDFMVCDTGTEEDYIMEASVEQSRRKRRKVTPASKGPSPEDTKPVNQKKAPVGTISWFTQPKASNIANGKVQTQDSHAHQADDLNNDQILPTSSDMNETERTFPSESQDRFGAAACKSVVDSDKKTLANPGVQDLAVSPKSKKTPKKKKTVSLHSNGTLLSSPRTSPRLSRPDPGPSSKNVSSRKMKMRSGKFVHSLSIVLSYAGSSSRQAVGEQIENIISSNTTTPEASENKTSATTHPFFLGKVAPKPTKKIAPTESEDSTRNTDNEDENIIKPVAPIPWKDIKFSTKKSSPFKSIDSMHPAWPSQDTQHVGCELPQGDDEFPRSSNGEAKLKTRTVQLNEEDDILRTYGSKVKTRMSVDNRAAKLRKREISGNEVIKILDSDMAILSSYPTISNLHARIKSGTSAFDRGEAAGQSIWPSRYAPTEWKEVLQPSCKRLYDWLKTLAVHQVKSGVESVVSRKEKQIRKKKRQSRLREELLDDFIVDSDEDKDSNKTKNAILITGPGGCGKTASVYAVAKELGFEVFEIHSGMRRSAKDIFDKVGDMTQNHLVQRGDDTSRSSSVVPVNGQEDAEDRNRKQQHSMSNFLGPNKQMMKSEKTKAIEPNSTNKEQKQSLILFEEVDILFEDDRGFWSGVQSLIQNSKRPVILTCNDISSIPIDELDLHTVLEYSPPDIPIVTEYLAHIAAAEGHLIDRAALSSLYASKGHDLRASITELNLWCQMTVGSQYGGLDWMLQSVDGRPQTNEHGERLRVISQDTYRTGLDLLPQAVGNEEDEMKYIKDELGFAIVDYYSHIDGPEVVESQTHMDNIQSYADLADARSCLDIFDEESAPTLAATLIKCYHDNGPRHNRQTISSLYNERLKEHIMGLSDLVHAFVPLMEEKATFPPAQGRLAPSLDSASSKVAVDIAPYVRSIVSFDTRLEHHRDQISGSQGKKTRTTRAARAAAEGGDKAKTRSDRWFPKHLDFDRVLQTGNSWPEWYEGSAPFAFTTQSDRPLSSQSSMEE